MRKAISKAEMCAAISPSPVSAKWLALRELTTSMVRRCCVEVIPSGLDKFKIGSPEDLSGTPGRRREKAVSVVLLLDRVPGPKAAR